MKFIYRIENEQGIGPYRGGDPLDFNYTAKHCGPQCPSPWRDPDFREFWNSQKWTALEPWQFGFKSMQQLRKWFSDREIKDLERHGFYVVAIPISMVKSYKIGKKQIIFKYR